MSNGEPPPSGTGTRSVRISATNAAPRAAREFVRRHLTRGDVDPADQHDIVLLVSELVSNAVVHGRAPIDVTIRLEDWGVTGTVSDAATAAPTPRNGGFGLMLVDGLAKDWGITRTDGGKTVWFQAAFTANP